MTPTQEEALHNFLENITEPFTLENVSEFVRMLDDSMWSDNLPTEIAALIDSRNVAFRLNKQQWVSRRGCFENVPFVITPTKLELLNGILIPGHRCIPFANPVIMPHDYKFFWEGKEIPWTTTEGAPEEFYPYYYIFGEEYAPQYVARDNPDNEDAFSLDPFEDPLEVSIHTLDMTNIFREAAFVPGDRFLVRTRDWKDAHFDLEKSDKNAFSQPDLFSWFEAAEIGFKDSFALLGPGVSTEEQIAYAYWYGGKRMRELPAYSLEEFLFEKTDSIENTAYGIETRFWFAGKDIPDSKGLSGLAVPPDRTYIENILYNVNIPISEYVILSYIRDALFRKETDIDNVLERIVPKAVYIDDKGWNEFADYAAEAMDEIQIRYTVFMDQKMGPIRQRVGELHTAVIELSARLMKSEMDLSWLPKHTFIMLSQIQGHAASLLEDLDSDESPEEAEIEAMDNSLDSMIEAFSDLKEMIEQDTNAFRRSSLLVIRNTEGDAPPDIWRTMQICIGGTDVWRRVIVPESWTLAQLHKLIQICLGWSGAGRHRFYSEGSSGEGPLALDGLTKIQDVCSRGLNDLHYEYGPNWNIKVIMLSPYQPEKKESVRCLAGEGASPPEIISGPLRFRKMLNAIEWGSDMEKKAALAELGPGFSPGFFDIKKCNKEIGHV